LGAASRIQKAEWIERCKPGSYDTGPFATTTRACLIGMWVGTGAGLAVSGCIVIPECLAIGACRGRWFGAALRSAWIAFTSAFGTSMRAGLIGVWVRTSIGFAGSCSGVGAQCLGISACGGRWFVAGLGRAGIVFVEACPGAACAGAGRVFVGEDAFVFCWVAAPSAKKCPERRVVETGGGGWCLAFFFDAVGTTMGMLVRLRFGCCRGFGWAFVRFVAIDEFDGDFLVVWAFIKRLGDKAASHPCQHE
jgi:hypothetical protein